MPTNNRRPKRSCFDWLTDGQADQARAMFPEGDLWAYSYELDDAGQVIGRAPLPELADVTARTARLEEDYRAEYLLLADNLLSFIERKQAQADG